MHDLFLHLVVKYITPILFLIYVCVVHGVVLVKMTDRVVTTSNLCTCLQLAESDTGWAIGLRAMHAAQ